MFDVFFLITADQEARTYGEDQTPTHYAAKNDAVDSLRMLIKLECDIEVRDCKQRTPLQVAAELGINSLCEIFWKMVIKIFENFCEKNV